MKGFPLFYEFFTEGLCVLGAAFSLMALPALTGRQSGELWSHRLLSFHHPLLKRRVKFCSLFLVNGPLVTCCGTSRLQGRRHVQRRKT